MGSEHKQVIILRKDLVAQGAHARFTKICVSVNSEAELLAVHEKARAAGVLTHTAVAVGPDHAGKVDQITGELPLL